MGDSQHNLLSRARACVWKPIMGMMGPLQDTRVDWFRVLVQLQAEGYSLHGVAFFIGIPKSTLIAYKQGMQPSYNVGARIIQCWAEVTGNDPAKVPMISPYSFKA